MGFWNRTPITAGLEVELLKQRYIELGSLQAVAEAEKLDLAWLGRQLKAYDRRVGGSDANYVGPERRHR